MDEDGLPIVGSGIDLTKVSGCSPRCFCRCLCRVYTECSGFIDSVYSYQVPAIQQRRIVAFLNQFIVHTVRFLNRFSTVCEEVANAKANAINLMSSCISFFFFILGMYLGWSRNSRDEPILSFNEPIRHPMIHNFYLYMYSDGLFMHISIF